MTVIFDATSADSPCCARYDGWQNISRLFNSRKPGLDGRVTPRIEKFDLDDPEVLIGSGIVPSQTDFRSHQQTVYAVATAVLEAVERGLGRPIVWHAGKRPVGRAGGPGPPLRGAQTRDRE